MAEEAMVRKGWCGPCHQRCSLLVHFKGDRAVKVEGDPDHPLSRGNICQRGRMILEHLYHPDRLNYPLKRTGAKGQGKWQKISWDQALDEISGKLAWIKDESGPEALAYHQGTYRTYEWPHRRFYNLFGSPNHSGSGLICMCPSFTVDWCTYGFYAQGDIINTNCVVIWGYQPSQSLLIPLWRDIVAAKKSGAKIIVVDPRRTRDAQISDLWLQVRPGTDLALLIGWLKVIIDENLFDKEFVENWTVGFDQLKEQIQDYSLQKIAEITWVPEEKIVTAAKMYATSNPAVITQGLALECQGINSIQAIRARSILRAITGNMDVKGGELLGAPGTFVGITGEGSKVIHDVEMELNEVLTPSQREKQLGSQEYKLMSYPGWELIVEASKRLGNATRPPTATMTSMAHPRHLWKAIITRKPYPVKGLIIQANNTLLQAADTNMVYQALTSPNLELLVVTDYYMTPTAALADYVMPAAGTLERSDFPASPKTLEPLYERRDDFQFWRGLGIRLGQEEYWPWKTVEEFCDYRLKPLGVTFEEMVKRGGIRPEIEYRKYQKQGFATPSGKVEIYSNIFEKLGLDPLPTNYQEPPETPVSAPEMAKDFPLILITCGTFMPMYHSEMRQLSSAIKLSPDPCSEIHPDTARTLDIADGDWVWIETSRGRIKQRARLSDNIHPSMVWVPHGWWFPNMPAQEPYVYGLWESNANVLCPIEKEHCNVEVGGWPHTALLCRVSKVTN